MSTRNANVDVMACIAYKPASRARVLSGARWTEGPPRDWVRLRDLPICTRCNALQTMLVVETKVCANCGRHSDAWLYADEYLRARRWVECVYRPFFAPVRPAFALEVFKEHGVRLQDLSRAKLRRQAWA